MKRIELLKALEIVKPGLATKEMVAQTTSFAFLQDKIVTYNNEISISYPVKGLDIIGAIKAEQFYKLLEKLKDEDIELQAKKAEIIVTGKHSKAGIPFQAEITLPEIVTEKLEWKPLPDDFLDGVAFSLFSCSKDMSRPTLTCINVKQDGIIESTDNYRLSSFELQDKKAISPFLLPASAAEKLLSYNVTQFALGDGWVHFKTDDNCIFSARTSTGEFPSFTTVVKQFESGSGIKILSPKELPNILDRAMIFTKTNFDTDQAVTLTFENGKVAVKAKGEGGWFEEIINTDYNDKATTFAINPLFLKDICTKTDHFEITENMVKFEGDNWTHIAALVINNA